MARHRPMKIIDGRSIGGSDDLEWPWKEGGPQRSTILRVRFISAHTLWRRTTKFDVTHTHGREFVLGRQPRPTSRRRDPSAPQFWGIPSYLCLHPRLRCDGRFYCIYTRWSFESECSDVKIVQIGQQKPKRCIQKSKWPCRRDHDVNNGLTGNRK